MSAEMYIFAGGGTGGHLYPGLAVARELMELRPEARIVFACSDRDIDGLILDPLGYPIVRQKMHPLPHKLREIIPFVKGWRASKQQARQMIADLKPSAVLGLGGFAAVAVVRAAARGKTPTALLNHDAVPGKANRYLAARSDVIFTQFETTAKCFSPKVARKVQPVGCPVRREFFQSQRTEALSHFGLKADKKTLLINGGSQGALAINEAVSALAGSDALVDLADRWQVLHITGPSKSLKAQQVALERIAVARLEYCDRMDLAYAAADLAVCRGGASTVAELAATATPAVILPYPYHKDQQQRFNAEPLARVGAAIVCQDARKASLNAAALRRTLVPILGDLRRLDRMHAAAESLARPNAARDVAAWLAGERGE